MFYINFRMFITAICFIFLIKLRGSNKTLDEAAQEKSEFSGINSFHTGK